jgi:hypothetical protein
LITLHMFVQATLPERHRGELLCDRRFPKVVFE